MKTQIAPQKILFARIGYMKYYAGSQPGDKRPTGGGRFNKKKTGHELYNFRAVGGRLWGYYQPFSRHSIDFNSISTNLARIAPSAKGEESVEGVTVIFIAPSARGQVIVGWYQNATVHRHFRDPKASMKRDGYMFNLEASAKDAVLLPLDRRFHTVPRRKGATGQANATYVLNKKGGPRRERWIKDAVQYVREYQGGNLLESPEEDLAQEIADKLENHRTRQTGHGLIMSPQLRKAIERHAVHRATRHFESASYQVDYVGDRCSYDLVCRKKGSTLHVEVKGTQTDGSAVLLTRNEVKHARNERTALFILHSIHAKKHGKSCKVTGGKPHILNPWRIDTDGKLTPTAYEYRLG